MFYVEKKGGKEASCSSLSFSWSPCLTTVVFRCVTAIANTVRVYPIILSLPKNGPELRAKWIFAIRRDVGQNFQLGKHTQICSRHFTRNDYRAKVANPDDVPSLGEKRKNPRLKDDAIPCVFPEFPQHLQKTSKKRKSPSLLLRKRGRQARHHRYRPSQWRNRPRHPAGHLVWFQAAVTVLAWKD